LQNGKLKDLRDHICFLVRSARIFAKLNGVQILKLALASDHLLVLPGYSIVLFMAANYLG